MTDKTVFPDSETPNAASNATTPPTVDDAATRGAKANPNAVWMGTAVGVGSAALVAALMYASRRNKKK